MIWRGCIESNKKLQQKNLCLQPTDNFFCKVLAVRSVAPQTALWGGPTRAEIRTPDGL